MKQILLLIIIILNTSIYSKEEKKENIEKFKNLSYIIKPFFREEALYLSINSISAVDNQKHDIKYKPNADLKLGLEVSIYDWALSFSISPPKSQDDIEKYGKTTAFDIQLNYIDKNFELDIYIQKYKGFYLLEIEELNSESDVLALREDLSLKKLGVNFLYTSNDNFSLKTGFRQNKIQKKSVSSFILLYGIEYFSLKGDKNLIPKELNEKNILDFIYYGGEYYTFSIAPGYGYISNNEGFFFSGIFFLGLGIQYQKNIFDARETQTTLSLKLNTRVSFGYRAENYSIGILVIADGTLSSVKTVSIQQESAMGELYWSYRL